MADMRLDESHTVIKLKYLLVVPDTAQEVVIRHVPIKDCSNSDHFLLSTINHGRKPAP